MKVAQPCGTVITGQPLQWCGENLYRPLSASGALTVELLSEATEDVNGIDKSLCCRYTEIEK